eukprot:s72_g2.t1
MDAAGDLYRSTLVKHGDAWDVLEFCEPLECNSEGHRDLITIMTESEKDPRVMGFSFDGNDGELQGNAQADGEMIDAEEVAPEDDADIQGHDVDAGGGDAAAAQGVDIPDKILVEPAPDDKIIVDGVELTASSTLALLRTALKHNGLSTSGSKAKCFSKLLNHQRKVELEIVHAAAKSAEDDMKRDPVAPTLAEPPNQHLQDQHNLTFLMRLGVNLAWPFVPVWTSMCVTKALTLGAIQLSVLISATPNQCPLENNHKK